MKNNNVDIRDFTSDTVLYDALCRSTDDYIYICDMEKELFYFPERMVEEFGLPGCIVENAVETWGELIHEKERDEFYRSFQDILDGKTEVLSQEYRVRNREGQWIWLRSRGYLKHNSNGIPTLFAGIITNIGKKGKVDHVSGLPNKFEFESYVRSQMVEINKGCLLLLGLDNFKHINNLYGQEFGDLVLRATAKQLQEILPAQLQIYRMDGDVFGVFFPDGDLITIETAFYAVQKVFRKQQELNGHMYTCTISAGCTYLVEGNVGFTNLFKQAEYALEYAKTEGKNRLSFHNEETMKGRERSLTIIELLRQSVEYDFRDFELHFQPQVDATTCKIVSAEALLRWKCKEYGSVPPIEFIPLLEQTGMINQVGYWVLDRAALVCEEWRKVYPEFTVSVNLSYLQLMERNFIPLLAETLKCRKLENSALHLELTESRIADGSCSLSDVFDKLRLLGFCIEMDDFGTGYSSLEILKNKPADVVKIDRAFVKNITRSDFDTTFIKFVVTLCHSVNIIVCLEGVESWEEYELVKGMELDLIQGFLFGKPACKEEFERLYFDQVL